MSEQHSIQLEQGCPFGSQQKPPLLHMVEQQSVDLVHIPVVGVQLEPLDDALALLDDALALLDDALAPPPVPLVEEVLVVLAVELLALVEEPALEALLLSEVELALEALLLFEVELGPCSSHPWRPRSWSRPSPSRWWSRWRCRPSRWRCGSPTPPTTAPTPLSRWSPFPSRDRRSRTGRP